MRGTEANPTRKPYPSDLTDAQWAWIEDLVPKPRCHPNFPKPVYSRREIVNGILYVLRTGCPWRHLPHDLPLWQIVYHYFYIWRPKEALDNILKRLHVAARTAVGRKPTPTLGIIDSQSVKTTEATAQSKRGFDAAKKVKGRKRHILVDACGIVLAVVVTAASVQDRDGAVSLLHIAHHQYPTITKVLADGAYVGDVMDKAMAETGIDVEITKRSDQVRGFVPVRLRWAVERTFAWVGRYRRTSKDDEKLCKTEESIVKWATVAILLRRLAPSGDADSITYHY